MSNPEIPKKNWFLRHKFLTVIFAVIAIAIIATAVNAGKNNGELVSPGNNDSNSDNSNSAPVTPEKFKVGDVISFDNKLVSILSVEHGWTGEFVEPEAGNKFVKIVAQIENKSNERIDFNVISDWSIQDQNGKIVGASLWASSAVDNAYSSGELAADGKLTGAVVFEVPDIDGQLVFIYEPGIWSSDELEIYE